MKQTKQQNISIIVKEIRDLEIKKSSLEAALAEKKALLKEIEKRK